MSGWIYFVQPTGGGLVKIGWAKDPLARLRTLQTGSPVKLEIRATVAGSVRDEKALHTQFAGQRTHGEWFTPTRELERAAGVRLCASGSEIMPAESGGPRRPLHGPMPNGKACDAFWAYARADGWASTQQMRYLGWELPDAVGATLAALRNRGLLQCRKVRFWDGWGSDVLRTEWAPWWVQEEIRAPRNAKTLRRMRQTPKHDGVVARAA